VGGDVFDESTRCIAFGGRILSIGFTSGRLPVLPVNIALIKGFSVMGVRAGEYGRQNPAKGRENHEAIWNLAEEGKVKPRVDAEYALDDWRAAFDSLADRKVIGKTVIRPDPCRGRRLTPPPPSPIHRRSIFDPELPREADFPTVAPRSRPPPRLPPAHVHQERTEGAGPPPRQGPQAPERLSL
jgi:hypothetical protein